MAHRQLSEAGIPVAIVNPRKVKALATGMGNAKTNTLDVRLLAQYAERVRPARVLVPHLTSQQLSELVSRRRQLVEMQVAEKNRLSRASETVKADLTEPIEQLQQRLDSLNEQIQRLSALQAHWQLKRQILRSVPGMGKVMCAVS